MVPAYHRWFRNQLVEIYVHVVADHLICCKPHFHSVTVLVRHKTTIKHLISSEPISDLFLSLNIRQEHSEVTTSLVAAVADAVPYTP